MDIDKKVERLLQITTTLKNEINEIKGEDLNTKLNELEWEKEALKNDIIDLRHTLMQQNEKILFLIRKQNQTLFSTIEADKLTPPVALGKEICGHAEMFPIKSIEELNGLEAYIRDHKINELVPVVQQLLSPYGIVKNINAVLSTECIVECNVDGHHNKKRLLNYKHFLDILFQAAYYDGYSRKTFLDEVRRGLKLVKARRNKNLFRIRQLQRQEEKQKAIYNEEDVESTIEDIDELDILPGECLKTEEILCD